jgi:tetratricopeptide (TPR) repeat protein
MSEARDADTIPPVPRWLTIGLLTTLLIAAIIVGATWTFFGQRPSLSPPPRGRNLPPDPRLTYDGPFGNIRPGVAFLHDDNRCVPCHADLCASYRRHPMGRSLAPMEAAAEDDIRDAAHHNPFEAQGFHFAVQKRGGQVWHEISRNDASGRPLAALSSPVHFVLGSGTRGRSYLSEQEGYLFQTPISWFAQKQIWDLSPGFSESALSGRPVTGSCLFCHANHASFHEGSVNRFDRPVFSGHAIGCERCHGPAERHVQTLRPLDVVNPRRLAAPALRDAVCEQCHLKGEARVAVRGRALSDFRPGLAFAEFCTVFVTGSETAEEGNAVSHFEQMHVSRCYQHSADEKDRKKLGCVSCHDPHVYVEAAARSAHYRGRCLQCHDTRPCGLPLAARLRKQAEDSCIACHMPRFQTTDIAHTAVTDHRILRRPAAGAAPVAHLPSGSLVPFHPPSGGEPGRRDLGLALVSLLLKDEDDPAGIAAHAVPLLENALADDPDDVPAWQAKGIALLRLRRPAEALASFESALSRMPQQEISLAGAAEAALILRRFPESRAFWLRAVEANPRQPRYRAGLTRVLVQTQAWGEAKEQCRLWKCLEPWSSEAAVMEITCLLQEGDVAAARTAFAHLEALRPANLDPLRHWFNQQVR